MPGAPVRTIVPGPRASGPFAAIVPFGFMPAVTPLILIAPTGATRPLLFILTPPAARM